MRAGLERAAGPRQPLRPVTATIWIVLGAVAAAAWAYLFYQDWAMRHMDMVEMAMPSAQSWNAVDLALVFVMWAVMMVAMMLPSAAPMVSVFGRIAISRCNDDRRAGLRLSWAFTGGYLVAWTCFSLLATLAQWALHAAALDAAAMTATPLVGGVLLLAAGIYQWTPLKLACLAQCRAPLGFLLNHWRDGMPGALAMGFRHGALCLGCCWMLMLLLFVLGVMNLAWIAALSLLVLVEKVAPHGDTIAKAGGVGFAAWGCWLLLGGIG